MPAGPGRARHRSRSWPARSASSSSPAGRRSCPPDARFAASPAARSSSTSSAPPSSRSSAPSSSPPVRRRRPGWHRRAGRVLVVAGLGVALSALWLTSSTRGRRPPASALPAPAGFGSAMVVTIVLGFAAIRRRDIARHRAWMIRSYALGARSPAPRCSPSASARPSSAPASYHRPAHGRSLGDQPRRRRVDHPPPRGPPDRRTPRPRTVGRSDDGPPPATSCARPLRAPGRGPPRRALVDLVRRPRPSSTRTTVTTTLRGAVADQAELHGLLAKVRDLGATLISVTLTHGDADPGTTRPQHQNRPRPASLQVRGGSSVGLTGCEPDGPTSPPSGGRPAARGGPAGPARAPAVTATWAHCSPVGGPSKRNDRAKFGVDPRPDVREVRSGWWPGSRRPSGGRRVITK